MHKIIQDTELQLTGKI